MLLCFFVVDEQFPLGAIPSRLVAGDLHNGEIGAAFAEDGVHLFEGAVGGFGVEEVDDWDYKSVAVQETVSYWEHERDGTAWSGKNELDEVLHDSKDDVSLVFDGCESHRCDHHDHKVECLDVVSLNANDSLLDHKDGPN